MAVVALEIERREPYVDGARFGEVGAYERLDGQLTFAVDPLHAANTPIVDLALAPRDSDGRVRFRADLTLLTPADPSRGRGTLLVELPNRGRRRAVASFNRSGVAEPSEDIDPGDGFLFRHGFGVASIGWQWDVYRSKALLGLEAPVAQQAGKSICGQTMVEFRPNVPERTYLLANRVHRPYPARDLDEPGAALWVRDYQDGPRSLVPRADWRFAREQRGGAVPSREHVTLGAGFEPGRIYQLVYTTEGAPVVGTGLLAVRDVAVFLRHPSALNPCGGYQRTIAYGVSQTGRMLRHLLYLGLNRDEQGRRVYDGLLPHIAGGRRGEFNHRFAQPSAQSVPGFGHLFPFADDETRDPIGEASDGLLKRVRRRGDAPKVIYTNTSAEYWRGDGSLVHMDPGGLRDLPPTPESRVYHFAGTQHVAGRLPQQRTSPLDGATGRFGFNVVDHSPLQRAALVNLDRWLAEELEPPPGSHPRIEDGSAVERSEVLRRFETLPDKSVPDPERLWVVRRVELGPDAATGVGRYPAGEGAAYPCLVSAVDSDGNELAGIRLPDLVVPVATHSGWNLRDAATGSPEQILPMLGASRFFCATRHERERLGDPRPSLEERYPSRTAYLDLVRDAAVKLVNARYALEEDVELMVANAGGRYDAALQATGG